SFEIPQRADGDRQIVHCKIALTRLRILRHFCKTRDRTLVVQYRSVGDPGGPTMHEHADVNTGAAMTLLLRRAQATPLFASRNHTMPAASPSRWKQDRSKRGKRGNLECLDDFRGPTARGDRAGGRARSSAALPGSRLISPALRAKILPSAMSPLR